MMKRAFPIVFVLLVFVSVVTAQVDCPTIVEDALTAAGDACADVGRNQACYGNFDLTVTSRGAEDVLEDVGDVADLVDIEALTLSGLDEDAGVWGVAVLQVQANLPDTLPGQNVTMLLFGDVEITDAAEDVEDEDYLPMQAFYFRSGVGDAACAEAPDSGILIQTPEGAGTIELTMNDVNITLGSTAYIQAEAEGEMVFNVIEGGGIVEAEGVERSVPQGSFVSVPLDEDLQADGEPSEPEPYEEDAFSALPLELLPREIEVAEPASEEDLAGGGGATVTVQSGTWRQSFDSMEGCGLDSSMLGSIPVTDFEITGSDIETMFSSAGGTMNIEGTDMDVQNPEPNVYVVQFSIEGGTSTTTYTVISPTLIEFVSETASDECTIVVTGVMEHVGD